jgi:hypothetical protein
MRPILYLGFIVGKLDCPVDLFTRRLGGASDHGVPPGPASAEAVEPGSAPWRRAPNIRRSRQDTRGACALTTDTSADFTGSGRLGHAAITVASSGQAGTGACVPRCELATPEPDVVLS